MTDRQPIHPPREPMTERQALIKRGADLCRRDPATWSRLVRATDRLKLEQPELDAVEAGRLIYDAYDALVARTAGWCGSPSVTGP